MSDFVPPHPVAHKQTPRKTWKFVSLRLSSCCTGKKKAATEPKIQDARREVPEVGLEPTLPCGNWILSPARLPFRHSGKSVTPQQFEQGLPHCQRGHDRGIMLERRNSSWSQPTRWLGENFASLFDGEDFEMIQYGKVIPRNRGRLAHLKNLHTSSHDLDVCEAAPTAFRASLPCFQQNV